MSSFKSQGEPNPSANEHVFFIWPNWVMGSWEVFRAIAFLNFSSFVSLGLDYLRSLIRRLVEMLLSVFFLDYFPIRRWIKLLIIIH